MTNTVIVLIAFVLAIISIKILNKKAKKEGYCCSDVDYCYGNRFRIYKNGNVFFIYDREFRTDISVYNKRMSFDSRQDAEEFLLEYGDLFACLENKE